MKTTYKTNINDGKDIWFGDKPLRIAFIITNLLELAAIIYLLLR